MNEMLNLVNKTINKRRKEWRFSEEKLLIANYETKTIKELKELLPGRDDYSINCKIKRLKELGKLTTNRVPETVKRAYSQRGRKEDEI